jgi:hypothetical protein
VGTDFITVKKVRKAVRRQSCEWVCRQGAGGDHQSSISVIQSRGLGAHVADTLGPHVAYIYLVFDTNKLVTTHPELSSSSSSPTYMASPLPVLLLTLSLSSLSAAYSWNFATPPRQCSNVTISLVGSGIPPYRVLVMPFGPSPLINGVEVRTVLEVAFPGDSTTVSFPLKYPANSQLVAVVSVTFSTFCFGFSVALAF